MPSWDASRTPHGCMHSPRTLSRYCLVLVHITRTLAPFFAMERPRERPPMPPPTIIKSKIKTSLQQKPLFCSVTGELLRDISWNCKATSNQLDCWLPLQMVRDPPNARHPGHCFGERPHCRPRWCLAAISPVRLTGSRNWSGSRRHKKTSDILSELTLSLIGWFFSAC